MLSATFVFSCLDRLVITPKAFGCHLKSPKSSFGLVSQHLIQRHQFPPQHTTLHYKDLCYTVFFTKLVPTRRSSQNLLLHSTLYRVRCYTTPYYNAHYYKAIFLKSLNYLIKKPNTILVTLNKKSKYYFSNILQQQQQQNPNSILATFSKKPNPTLATFYQKPKTINFWVNNYSIKAQVLFGKNIILCSKPKVNNLWRQHILTC